MAGLNKAMLIGNLTRDPELRYTAKGQPVCNFGLAINGPKVDGVELDPTFLNVTIWDEQAKSCEEHLKVGSLVFVEGRIKIEKWDKAGETRSKTVIIAQRVQFL